MLIVKSIAHLNWNTLSMQQSDYVTILIGILAGYNWIAMLKMVFHSKQSETMILNLSFQNCNILLRERKKNKQLSNMKKLFPIITSV